MTTKNNKDGDSNDIKPRDNIFQIMDGIIAQLNRTKKMFIIMILTLMIILQSHLQLLLRYLVHHSTLILAVEEEARLTALVPLPRLL
ncbi:MAG TPA: hypothetical protein VFR94_15770 [Nitrososphaeraceae archaeon]|nr:hypothetical protein [Nitrososphaeraceae archaeon]